MFINSISSQQANMSERRILKSNSMDKISFTGGLKPEIVKNQLKILLTQDIWAPKLKVKLPETPEEKEVLLEILENRQKLDRFTRLNNEKAQLKIKFAEIDSLSKNDPTNPRLSELKNEIQKKGNVNSIIQSLNKNIELEIKKNQPAYDYFKNIEKLEDEYIDKRLIKTSKMDKFWQRIKKENINVDEKYSTKELIDIISKKQSQEELINKKMSKKKVIGILTEKYEKFLRQYVNIYDKDAHHHKDAERAKQSAIEVFDASAKAYPDMKKQFSKIYEFVQKKFLYKINRLSNINIYPLGEIWDSMHVVEKKLGKAMQEVENLKLECIKNPNDSVLKDTLKVKEAAVNEMKKEWIEGLEFSGKYELSNRKIMTEAGRLQEYDYLTADNKMFNRYKSAFEVYKNNNNQIPEDRWAEFIAVED